MNVIQYGFLIGFLAAISVWLYSIYEELHAIRVNRVYHGSFITIHPYKPAPYACTETLDRLYLELSQVTQARTRREIAYEMEIRKALKLTVPGSAVGGILRCALKDGGADET